MALGSNHRVDLDDPWPHFLDQLDSDRGAAFEGLFAFLEELFRVRPPRAFVSLGPADREDALHEVLHHCCKDDLLVLRCYQNRGKPFSRWLRRVASSRILDLIRKEARKKTAVSYDDVAGGAVAGRPAVGDGALGLRQAVRTALDCLCRMDEESQILLLASASGLTPLQITEMLGWSRAQNARVSDLCRYRRSRLHRLMSEAMGGERY